MVKDVTTISPNDNLITAVEKMHKSDSDEIINQLVVMDEGSIIGIISDGDILKAIKT